MPPTTTSSSEPVELISLAEENYLKAIFHLCDSGEKATTSAIAERLQTKPASVSDMLRKLKAKGLLHYEKYKAVYLTDSGRKVALKVIRKHRLWEYFLVEKLQFAWDEVHVVAEQLEHIRSPHLVERLDEFLGYPKYDPHGDPIPDRNGEFSVRATVNLLEAPAGSEGPVVAVDENSPEFLQFLDRVGIQIGSQIRVEDHIPFDESTEVSIDGRKRTLLSKAVASNIAIGK